MQDSHENRIRALAYQIWESEGRPIGHESRHWEMASILAREQGTEELKKAVTTATNNVVAETFNIDPGSGVSLSIEAKNF